MQTIIAQNYAIYFSEAGYLALNDLLEEKKYSKIFILVDTHTNTHCLPSFMAYVTIEASIEIIEIEPGESIKSVVTCVELWQLLTEMGADRKSLLINLGGGVVTDIGGFVAATFKRGIDFINIPTTLLGMVDAAIGGKNGIDLGHLKNQVGTITDPVMLLIDPLFLETLPKNQLRSGMAEMLKHGLIANNAYWEKFKDLSQYEFDEIIHLIRESVVIKNNIVMADSTENGIRKTLNFGHTLGHAIESHFLDKERPLLHGEAIAMGMLLESNISMRKKLLSVADYLEIKTTINDFFPPVALTTGDVNAIINLLRHDKKNEYGKIKFCLLNKIGSCVIDQDVHNDLILSAFKEYSQR